MNPQALPARWRDLANDLEPYSNAAAVAWRAAASELETAIRERDEEALTLSEAADRSGYSERTLRQRLSDGDIENLGRRVRRSDLPRKARPNVTTSGYDPAADARQLINGRGT